MDYINQIKIGDLDIKVAFNDNLITIQEILDNNLGNVQLLVLSDMITIEEMISEGYITVEEALKKGLLDPSKAGDYGISISDMFNNELVSYSQLLVLNYITLDDIKNKINNINISISDMITQDIITSEAAILSGNLTSYDAVTLGYVTGLECVQNATMKLIDAYNNGFITKNDILSNNLGNPIYCVDNGIFTVEEAIESEYLPINEALMYNKIDVYDAIDSGYISADSAVINNHVSAIDLINKKYMSIAHVIRNNYVDVYRLIKKYPREITIPILLKYGYTEAQILSENLMTKDDFITSGYKNAKVMYDEGYLSLDEIVYHKDTWIAPLNPNNEYSSSQLSVQYLIESKNPYIPNASDTAVGSVDPTYYEQIHGHQDIVSRKIATPIELLNNNVITLQEYYSVYSNVKRDIFFTVTSYSYSDIDGYTHRNITLDEAINANLLTYYDYILPSDYTYNTIYAEFRDFEMQAGLRYGNFPYFNWYSVKLYNALNAKYISLKDSILNGLLDAKEAIYFGLITIAQAVNYGLLEASILSDSKTADGTTITKHTKLEYLFKSLHVDHFESGEKGMSDTLYKIFYKYEYFTDATRKSYTYSVFTENDPPSTTVHTNYYGYHNKRYNLYYWNYSDIPERYRESRFEALHDDEL